ncbi:hypothetical protein T12_3503 [Trichinella patagoniensis]|uniref:Uncharacterized protein n=1 Tax=Trichinella patagoniensis TaxID=990121 RepID=A0A0V0Z552_9BILA|nr:hypothetical protein T12_3503 [Trichinella patagoniensis]
MERSRSTILYFLREGSVVFQIDVINNHARKDAHPRRQKGCSLMDQTHRITSTSERQYNTARRAHTKKTMKTVSAYLYLTEVIWNVTVSDV